MAIREFKEIEVWIGQKDKGGYYKGKWIKTKAIVSPSELCLFPTCNRRIPSKKSGLRTLVVKIPKGYCSAKCRKKHKRKEHKISKLDQFIEEKSI